MRDASGRVISAIEITNTMNEGKPLSGEKREKGLSTGEGKILLMDDEEVVRVVAGHMIKSLGYEVEFAENGEQAYEKYSNAVKIGCPFDAVILDLTVRGGMGGEQTIRKIMEIDPAINAAVSSGYSDDSILSNYKEYGFKAMLPKPYKLQELGSMLHALVRTRSMQ